MTAAALPLRARQSTLVALLRPEWATWTFSVALLIAYAIVPLGAYFVVLPDPVFLRLVGITTLGVASMWLGASLPIADARFASRRGWVVVDPNAFIAGGFAIFAVFLVVTFATAPSIPILSAFQGADPDALSQERGDFLKGRAGWQLALLYISTFLVNTVVPYGVVLAYAIRARARHVLAVTFFLFCISFLQKALFLNLLLPLVSYAAISGRLRARQVLLFGAAAVGLLIAFTYLTSGEGSGAGDGAVILAEVLSAQYAPATPFGYFLWRAFAVPVFSATDTLVVHAQYFDGRPLLGATSLLVSAILGVERINLERFVFEYQFGGWNDVANSNTMFLIDGYVNFGWLGVVAFGLLVGQALRWFRLSPDAGVRSLWSLFTFVLFSAPLLGMLFSNGFLYMFLHAVLLRPDGGRRDA